MQIKMPNGDMVEFPDDMPKDQIQGMIEKKFPSAGNTRGGDLLRGLGHGLASGVGMAGGAPEGSSGWRQTGEAVGEAAPAIAAGFIPGGMAVKGLVGAGAGALQPADSLTGRLENAAIGGGSALTGGLIGKMPPAMKTALDHLAEMGIGGMTGYSHLGPWGGLGGMYAGHRVGREIERMTGGRGLADLVAMIANNPGLAAYLGIKAAPAASEAGKFVGNELGKLSQ